MKNFILIAYLLLLANYVYSTSTTWEDLPNEVKYLIAIKSDINSLGILSTTSKLNKKITKHLIHDYHLNNLIVNTFLTDKLSSLKYLDAVKKKANLILFLSFNITNKELFKEFLKYCGYVNILSVGFNKTDGNEVKKISQLPNLVLLSICGVKIHDEESMIISSMSNLHTLELTGNEIGDMGAINISKMSNLTVLNLSYNQLGNKAAKAISSMTGLKRIFIHANNIGDKGAEKFAKMLKVKELMISYNKISFNGARALLSMLKLKKLDLSYNNIDGDDLKKYNTKNIILKNRRLKYR